MALSHAILATLLSGLVSEYKLTKRFNTAMPDQLARQLGGKHEEERGRVNHFLFREGCFLQNNETLSH